MRANGYTVVAGLAGCTLLLAFGLPLRDAWRGGTSWAPGSSHGSGPRGTRALFLLLGESGQRVERLTWRVPAGPARLVSIEPGLAPSSEAADLVDWVRAGGVLVLAPALDPALDEPLAEPEELDEHEGHDHSEPAPTPAPRARPTPRPDPDEGPRPSALHEAFGLQLEPQADPPSWRAWPRGARVLEAVAERAAVVEVTVGRGRLVAVADPRRLENGGLAQDANLALAIELLALPGPPVLFDDYRHGLAENAGLGYVLARYGLLPAAAAFVLLTGLVAWRTLPAEAEVAPEAETSAPRFDAALETRAGLYARVLGPAEAVPMLERDLRHALAHAAGVRAGRDFAATAARVAARRPEARAELDGVAHELAALASRSPRTLADLLPVAGRGARLAASLSRKPRRRSA